MKFSEILLPLRGGAVLKRQSWSRLAEEDYYEKMIMIALPQYESPSILLSRITTPNAQKLVESFEYDEAELRQDVIAVLCPIANNVPLRIEHYVPTWNDIFADDWEVITN